MKSSPSRGLRSAAAALALIAAAGASPPASDATAVATEGAQTLAAERHGAILFEVNYSYEERGPGHDKTNDSDELQLRDDGKLVAIRILRESSGGNPAGASDLAKDQAQVDKQLPPDDYVLPTNAEGLRDYTFAPAACSDCAASTQAVAFRSNVRDDEHGDGVAAIDIATHHVLWLQFSPSVLPSHVDKATINMTFGRALRDLWDLTGEEQRYDGHVLFIHGWADVKRTYRNYRRYPTLEAARRALSVTP